MTRKRGTSRNRQRPRPESAGRANGGSLAGRAAALERECRRLERLLSKDENWRALDRLVAAEERGEVQSGDRAKLEAALEANPLFRARRELREAIAILRAVPAPRGAAQRPSARKTPPARTTISDIVAHAAQNIVAGLGSRTAAVERQTPEARGPGDNLEMIRGIDGVTAERLTAAGINRFADIARWSAADVARISREIGAGRRIQREGWIEQAAVLAAGRPTRFASESGWQTPATPAPATSHPDAATQSDVRRRGEKRSAKRRSILAALQRVRKTAHEETPLSGNIVYDDDDRTAGGVAGGPMPEQTRKPALSPAAADAPAREGGNGSGGPAHSERWTAGPEFPFREWEEAEVTIIERTSSFPVEEEDSARRQRWPARPGSLGARLRRSREPEILDAHRYAGYRDVIGESEVEIVRYDAPPGEEDETEEKVSASGIQRLARFFRSLTGH